MLMPKRVKWRKQMRGRMTGHETRGVEISFGEYGLQALEPVCRSARQIDAAHFSHPQLLLAEIHLRRGERREAAAVLEEFLKYHPDWPQAAKMRQTIPELRQ